MTKKDFFVITESDNLYLDLASCSGYVVLDTMLKISPLFLENKEKAKMQKDGTQFIKNF